MIEVKQVLNQIKNSISNVNYDRETANGLQSYISQLESELEQDCGEGTIQVDKAQYLYFLNIFNFVSTDAEVLSRVEPEKIRMTLRIALPQCHCPPPKKCPRAATLESMTDFFLERLHTKAE